MNGIWVRGESGKTLALVDDLFISTHGGKCTLCGSKNRSNEWIVIAEYRSEKGAQQQLDDIQRWMTTEGTETRKMGNTGYGGTNYSPFVKTGENTLVMPRVYDLRERKVKEVAE